MTGRSNKVEAFRGSFLHYLRDPGPRDDPASFEYLEDGVLIVENGNVEKVGDVSVLLRELPSNVQITDYTGNLIVPGFIDTHIHYSQTDIIASHGEQLLEWLECYTFPAEAAFIDPAHAAETADFFIEELLRNGTTTALVFTTVHPQSVDAIFKSARAKALRLIAGKVLMDRHCPVELRDTPESAYAQSRTLIERWHGVDRLLYAITPRFAPTSSDEQLTRAGQLAAEFDDVYIQTHVAENQDEIAWVEKLFPKCRSYLDVYRQFGLLRDRTVLAHGIYLDDDDRKLLSESGAVTAFCPAANFFLGSGMFDLGKFLAQHVSVGIGTDVGAGTSFSLLRTLAEAYKVAQMTGSKLTAHRSLYMATLGNAKSLKLEDKIGNFEKGKEADFVVLDLASTPLLARRIRRAKELTEKLFAMIILGDDRNVIATHILGEAKYRCARYADKTRVKDASAGLNADTCQAERSPDRDNGMTGKRPRIGAVPE